MRVSNFANLDAGNLVEKIARLRPNSLSVCEMTGVVIGDPLLGATIRKGGEIAELFQKDRYIAYSEQRGLIGVVGFAAHAILDRYDIQHLKRLWRYFLARYSAYPITFLITQEYNADLGSKSTRVKKLLQLGHFIRATDPYRRAMSIHPWHHVRDTREAWSERWYDFVMLQAGHFGVPACASYLAA